MENVVDHLGGKWASAIANLIAFSGALGFIAGWVRPILRAQYARFSNRNAQNLANYYNEENELVRKMQNNLNFALFESLKRIIFLVIPIPLFLFCLLLVYVWMIYIQPNGEFPKALAAGITFGATFTFSNELSKFYIFTKYIGHPKESIEWLKSKITKLRLPE